MKSHCAAPLGKSIIHTVVAVDTLPDISRGTQGFGSTGLHSLNMYADITTANAAVILVKMMMNEMSAVGPVGSAKATLKLDNVKDDVASFLKSSPPGTANAAQSFPGVYKI